VLRPVILMNLKKKILEDNFVVHGDFEKYDWRLRHWLMQMVIQKLCKKFDLGTGWVKTYRIAVLSQVCKVLVSKNITCPFTGSPIYVHGLLPSGHFLTALMNSQCNWTMQVVVMMLMTGKSYEELREKFKLKVYGDDFLFVISKSLLPNFDKVKYSNLMKRIFNMIIPPNEVIICSKLFNREGATIDTSAPVFLQYQFYLLEKNDEVHLFAQRPFRPILSAKMLISSDHSLSIFELLQRIACIASLFAIRKQDYDELRDLYDSLYAQWDGVVTYRVDSYITDKKLGTGVQYLDLSKFPKYSDVWEINTFENGYRNYRSETMSWNQYREKFERQLSNVNVYHPGQLETRFD